MPILHPLIGFLFGDISNEDDVCKTRYRFVHTESSNKASRGPRRHACSIVEAKDGIVRYANDGLLSDLKREPQRKEERGLC